MVKIRLTTTLRNTEHLDGLAAKGTEVKVPESYAKELVNQNFAEYVENEYKTRVTSQGEFAKGFLQEDIPEDFPTENIYEILKEDGVFTFGQLMSFEDFTLINGIGPKYSSKIDEGIEVAYEKWTESN